MAQVDTSRSPYFDDYDPEKNFYEILFRPRRPVQTRELNQIQSMFKEQISRFGDHVFEEGSVVIPGETNYDLDLNYVKVQISNYESIANQLIEEQISLVGPQGITANVKLIARPTSSDPLTFYLEYVDSSTDGEVSKFQPNDVLQVVNNSNLTIANAIVQENGIASKFTMNSGVYYINKRFVLVEKETVLLDKYSNTPSKIVGIEYDEEVVTETDDQSLFDNAQGSPNFRAPGAHRLRVNTRLVVYDLSQLDVLPDNVVELFRIENGQLQKNVEGPNYSQIGKVLAQRTFEESGNYTVKSFKVSMKEYSDVFPDEPDDSKFVIGVEPGLAYVKGFRIQNLSTRNVPADKARKTGVINNSIISAALGYYVEVEDINVIPDIRTLQQISFYSSSISVPGQQPGGTLLGTANVRFIRKDGATFRLYIFNVKDSSGNRKTNFISSAQSVYSSVGEPFSANIVEAVINDASNNSLVYPMGVDFVKTLYDELGVSDSSFSTVKMIEAVTDTNGQVTVSAGSNEVFVAQDETFSFGSWLDTSELVDTHNNFSLGGSPLGSVITFNFGSGNAGRSVRILAQSAKQQVRQKTKTTQNGSKSGSLDGNGRIYLDRCDVFNITSVIDNNSNDVTAQFTLNQNKTDSFYDTSYVSGPVGLSYPVTVNFQFFSHSAGDFFGPDSYVDLDYEDIPVENGNRLSDVLDFRPRINNAGTSFSGVGAVVGNIPTPFTNISGDVTHYLGRKDKVFLGSDGEFGVVQGVPSLNPKLPEDPDDSMVLYKLDVPPYTFNLSDIQAEKVNNRRYTMKDIGDIEQRVSNVEYYVSLNALEQEAEAKQVIDPVTGLNRFKNGFLTDSFIDHSVGDFAWEGYHVSMSDEGELRPEFSLNAFDLDINLESSSNVVVKNGLVMLPYEDKSFIRQNLRSTTLNVNPYAVYRWSGDVTLTPSVDSWIDTVYSDPDVTYRVFNNGRLTQTWNSWQINWSGESSTTTSSATSRTGNTIRTATTTRTVRTNVDVVNDRLVDSSVIPFMRSIIVRIEGEGHRPKSRLNFFFDDVKINQYVRPLGSSYGSAVRADDDGDFVAEFRIPNSQQQRFRTGEKQIIVTDEPNNDRENSTSYGETTFSSTGVRNTRQRTVLATRNINTATRVTTQRIRTSFDFPRGDGGGGADPLAQSFLVEREGGVFITKVNVFFSTKDDNVPVKIQLREMENGFPTLSVVPGGDKTLKPSEVNVSSDGSLATTFEFPNPVYLLDGEEYCFVIMSNSNQYNAHIATLGGRDRGTGKYIVEQPYTGVLFKSQNNTTWTEDQESDIQFELFCAEFDTNVEGTLVLENSDLDDIQLPLNPVTTTQSSSEVIITRERHNYVLGNKIFINGAIGGNGVSANNLNGEHDVIEVLSPNEIKIDVGQSATVSGRIGGSNMFISDTKQAMLLNPNIANVLLPRTNVEYEVKGTQGKSIDGNETPYLSFTSWNSISNQEINELSVPWIITNERDESENLNGQKSFNMRALMRTDNRNISPVIDLQGANVISPFSMITRKQDVEADGSNNWANYRTNISSLKNPATSIRTFLDVSRPVGSDVIVSCRYGNSEEEVQNSEWTLLNTLAGSSEGSSSFQENEFVLEDLPEFTSYQILIQLKSSSSTNYPICKRLRVLALGT